MRLMVEAGQWVFASSSLSKNMSFHGERCSPVPCPLYVVMLKRLDA